ncbi:ral guanine nucleotide dissociation stimulator-like [Myotis myotis]|uniref:ral guanine nucleotide dissociation stimulator-like n=1 Tax=Myotis myotis TaxID=51298 RepID=UPI00174D72D6|nr:ral guanine nucleotide dissociation stimulator-like [Myotis myotis]
MPLTGCPSLPPQCAAEFTLTLCEAHRMRALQKGTLKKVAASLVPAFLTGNIPHICTLMPTHPAFSRAQRFLDELLTRATASVMDTWPDQAQYLGQPLLSPWFSLKQALVLHSRPAPHPVGLVRSLWVELAHLEPTEAQWEEPPPELKRTPEPEEGPAPGLKPGPAVVVLEPSGPPTLIRIPTTEPAPPPTTDYPRAGTPKHLIREEKVNILTFPPRLVAEQLTAMDAECRILRNFSSLHAILAALQSVAVHRLKKTWGKVSRKRALTMNKLCRKDNSLEVSREEGTREGWTAQDVAVVVCHLKIL